jgi:serine protease Do
MIVAGMALPVRSSAQPESQTEGQPYVFFGDEPGGSSYLGVDTRDITPDRVRDLHLKEESGVEVTMVDQDAPAGKAGLKEHDVILSINDQKIESEEQLRRVIREIPAGRTITIGISRDGQPMTLKAQLAEHNIDGNFNFNVPAVDIPAIHVPPINMPEIEMPMVVVIHSPRSSGIMVENLTPQLGDFFGVKSGNGVLVRSVEKGSRAEQAGFRAGDVIVKVNGSAVNDCSDFTRLLRDRKESKALVTVMRDHREQTLTLTMPEPRRSGSRANCSPESVTCAQVINPQSQLAQPLPELRTAEWKHWQTNLEQLEKQFREEMKNNRGQMKDYVEQMKQMTKQWIKDTEI